MIGGRLARILAAVVLGTVVCGITAHILARIAARRYRPTFPAHASAEAVRIRQSTALHAAVVIDGDARLNEAAMRRDGFEPAERDGVQLWVKRNPHDPTDPISMEVIAYTPSQEDFLVVIVYERFRRVAFSPRAFVTTLVMPLPEAIWTSGTETVNSAVIENTVRLFRVFFEEGYKPPADYFREAAKARIPFLETGEFDDQAGGKPTP